MSKIYLDNAAGCKVYPEVIKTMTNVLENNWGNASTETSFGLDARKIIYDVSDYIANDINCNPSEIIYTSGACESNSMAINGFLNANDGYDLITTNLEHTSIQNIVNYINTKQTTNVIHISNDCKGNIDIEELQMVLSHSHSKYLVSVCMANSEIGTIQDIKSVGELVRSYGGILHVDATQAYPFMKIDVNDLCIDMMSVSGQKFHAPRGIGFLYCNKNCNISPIIFGSQQESFRGGTMPTHLIAAIGKAIEITRAQGSRNAEVTRNLMYNELANNISGITLNGNSFGCGRLPNNLSLTIDGINASKLITRCDVIGLLIAKGSACKSYSPEPSKTLMSIGLSKEQALNTIRITTSNDTTVDEIYKASKIIRHFVQCIRNE